MAWGREGQDDTWENFCCFGLLQTETGCEVIFQHKINSESEFYFAV